MNISPFFSFSRSGPRLCEFENCRQPVDFFLKYWDRDIEENILQQTNQYQIQKGRTGRHIILEELRGFLAVNMVMGYHVLPSYRHYWSTQPDLGLPLVASVMTKNRFVHILGNLHINDNITGPRNDDKLWKVRPLVTSLNNNFVKLYDIKKTQSVDESMILFKGRSCLKQYCPLKPIKRGFKMWEMADPDGYITKFDIYQGKGTGAMDGFGLGENVVLTLTKDLQSHNHEVYFDNFFTSLPLLQHLKEHGINACGTIRSNRKGLPIDLKKDKEMERGDVDCRVSSDGLLVVKWMDNRSVLVASNFHATNIMSVDRTQKDGSKKAFPCPIAIKDYNAFMGGVDKADMLAALYGLSRKSKKWWHRLFFGLVDRTVINAFIAYKNLLHDNDPLLTFIREVALGLIALSRPPRVGRPLSSPCPSPVPAIKKRRKGSYSVCNSLRLQNVGIHAVVYVKERGRCEVCTTNKIQSRPHSKCKFCNVFLCSNEKKNCFNEFHEI